MTEPILSVRGLSKSFGGLTATDDVSLDVAQDGLHAIIGPNGAGKSTFVAQIIGELRPDRGVIRFKGQDVTGLPTPARIRRGMARSFQVTSLCLELSVLENVLLGSQLRNGGWLGFWKPAESNRAARDKAMAEISRVGLERRADVLAGELSHGEQRQVEVAAALASDPELILLDEPLAGLGHEEAAKMIALLQQLKGQVAMLMIEHDMQAVYSLADLISVLNFGRLIATGPVDEIRAHSAVREAYLGEEASLA